MYIAVRVVATGGLEAFGGVEAGQTAVLNPLKNRWQGHVYSCKSCCHGRVGSVWGVLRVVATEGLEAFGGFEAGQS